jgi:hypothetical protein
LSFGTAILLKHPACVCYKPSKIKKPTHLSGEWASNSGSDSDYLWVNPINSPEHACAQTANKTACSEQESSYIQYNVSKFRCQRLDALPQQQHSQYIDPSLTECYAAVFGQHAAHRPLPMRLGQQRGQSGAVIPRCLPSPCCASTIWAG